MDARSTVPPAHRLSGSADPLKGLAQWIVGTTTGGLFLVALLLLTRRSTGALVKPLDAPVLLLVAVALAGIAASLRLVWRRLVAYRHDVRGGVLVAWMPALALLLLGGALSLPQSSTYALIGFWAILAVEETASLLIGPRWLGDRARRGGARAAEPLPQSPDAEADGLSATRPLESPPQRSEEVSPDYLPPEVSQQITRCRDGDGSDVLYGMLRGRLEPGQRSLSFHVAFCPPFDRVPDLSDEQVEGPPAAVKQGQVLPYGARLDLRLRSASEEPQSVVLRIYAQSKPNGSADRSPS